MSEDNKPRQILIPFEMADLPALADALAIGRNTALMYGSKLSRERLDQLTAMVDALVPEVGRWFRAYTFLELCAALKTAQVYQVGLIDWRGLGQKVGVRVDDRFFVAGERKHSVQDISKLREFIEQLVPLDATEVKQDVEADMAIRIDLLTEEEIRELLSDYKSEPLDGKTVAELREIVHQKANDSYWMCQAVKKTPSYRRNAPW